MAKPRFGRRSTPPLHRQARKDATLPRLESKVILTCSEGQSTMVSYPHDGSSTHGALRLVPVKRLLVSDGPSTIDLVEWTGWTAWPHDDPTRLGRTLPLQWPKYAAISHVWAPSADAARLGREADRPLHIHVGKPEPHAISWRGLVQAAVVAFSHRCDYIWLDLLCINQVSRDDKKLQIMNMAKIYRHASMVIVMPGGVVAAQNFDQPSTWINRAWTFQEVTLGYPCYVLVDWSFPGSFSYFTKLQYTKRIGGIGAIAVAPLQSVVEHGPLNELGVAMLTAEDGTRIRQYESKSRVLCLGSDAAAVSALGSVIGTMEPSEEDNQNSFRSSAFYDPDDQLSNIEADEDDEEDEDDYKYVRSTWESAQARYNSFDGGTTTSSGFPPNLSGSSSDDNARLGPLALANSMGNDHTESNMASEAPGNPGAQDEHSIGPALLHFDAEVRYSSVWRSMWLRTSTKAQDLVYSMMHLLDVQIEVDYRRSVEELIFELVDRTRSAPAWLTIGYHIPVHYESGLIPLYPDFNSNLDPTFSFGGTVVPVSEIVCNGDFFCSTFYIDIKHSSMTDGHLICAPILNIDKISGHNPGGLDVESLSFHEVQLSLSCPPAYTVSTSCHFKGHVGSLAVVVGDHSQAGNLGSTDFSSKPFVFFLERKTGTWQKTGAGWVTEPLLYFDISAQMKRRHLRVGAGSMNAEPVECNCPNAAKYQPPDDSENVENLDETLGEATANGDERKLSRLVRLGANVNAQLRGIFGTPLLAACCNEKLRIVEFLLVSGANANMPAQVHLNKLDPIGKWYGTPLQSACLLGLNAVALMLIVKGGADVNANVGPEGSALQAAVRGDYNKALVQLLLDHGANANTAGGIHGTPLMAMLHSINPPPSELAELLVKHGANANSAAGKFITEDGWLCRSALQMACRYGDVETVRALLALGADANLQSGGSFATALQEAANCGESLICEILLSVDVGADVNAEGGYFHTALQAAVAGFLHGKASYISGIGDYIIQLLIDRGADLNTKGGYYGSALLAATIMGKYPTSQLLLDNGATSDGIPAGRPELHVGEGSKWLPDTLHFASNLGRVEVVEVLLERVLPIDRDIDERTALHLASAKGHIHIAHALLRAGADVLAVDRWGCTPLHLAASSGHIGLVQLFLDNGADPTIVDEEGDYAATTAAFEGHYDIMTLILDHVADYDTRQRVLSQMLLTLTEEGCYPALRLLIDSYQFDVAALDLQGRNAAHLAAQIGRLDILELLLSTGLNPYAFDRIQNGLLHYAARSSSIDMVRKALPFYTATSTESSGWLPLHWASRNGDVAMVRLLLESGLHKTTVLTVTPPGHWTPYAIAAFHQNNALLSALEADTELAANLGRLELTPITAVGPGQKYHEHQCDGCWLVRYVSINFVSVVLTDIVSAGYIWNSLPLYHV